MHTYTLHREQLIPKPLSEVFPFFERPENLATLTPPELNFIVLTPSPIAMEKGALIDYVIRVMGIRIRWTSRITDYTPPNGFVDEQIRGPYRSWHHRHTFTEKNGQTLAIDDVTYSLRFGLLGRIAHWVYVQHSLDHIFNYRTKMILELMG